MKRILVTGSSRGIGKSICYKFLESNYEVIGLSRGEPTIQHKNYTHHGVDASSAAKLLSLCEKIGRIDILVNNAAIFKYKDFSSMNLGDISEMIDINLKGPIFTTGVFLPYINNNGRIFFINSVAGLEQLENQSVYCATKHGLTGFAGVLGKELQDRGIKVTSIHPGGVNTPMWDTNVKFHDKLDQLLKPKDISDMVYFITQQNPNVETKTIKMYPDIEWHQ